MSSAFAVVDSTIDASPKLLGGESEERNGRAESHSGLIIFRRGGERGRTHIHIHTHTHIANPATRLGLRCLPATQETWSSRISWPTLFCWRREKVRHDSPSDHCHFWQLSSSNAVLSGSKRWGIPPKEVRPKKTRAMQRMHALWCLFIYELHIDYGVLLAACYTVCVVFLTLSRKRCTCQSIKNKTKKTSPFLSNILRHF